MGWVLIGGERTKRGKVGFSRSEPTRLTARRKVAITQRVPDPEFRGGARLRFSGPRLLPWPGMDGVVHVTAIVPWARKEFNMTIGAIIGTIIFGAVISILAQAVLPGRQSINAVVTVILGILGALIGYWV